MALNFTGTAAATNFGSSTDFSGGGTDFGGMGDGTGSGGDAMGAFEDGGYVDDYEGQGTDDAMVDPMSFVQSALDYGKQKYGLSGGEMGFDDGGVVPTEPDPETAAQGNPNAIDPRQAMAYLTGDGAVSPEIAQALEQRIDPRGEMNPTQRATAAIGVAPDDESRFGLLQHYRTKYNAYSGAAKAALARGDMGEAAQQATAAMDSVPNGQRTQFAPAQGGLAMMSRPAFAKGGGAPPQQAFARGGLVKSFEDGGDTEDDDEILASEYYHAGADPANATEDDDAAAAPVTANYRPQVGTRATEDPGVITALANEDAGEDAPPEAAPGSKVIDTGAPAVPPRWEVPGDETPEQLAARRSDMAIVNEARARRAFTDPLDDAYRDVSPVQDYMEQQANPLQSFGRWNDHPLLESAKTPQVLPAEAITKMLDEGFDAQLEQAGGQRMQPGAGAGQAPGPVSGAPGASGQLEDQGVVGTLLRKIGDLFSGGGGQSTNPIDQGFNRDVKPKPAIEAFPAPEMTSYALDQADKERDAQARGWGSAAEYAGTQQRQNMFDPAAKALQGSLLPTPATPAPTTGSEAATRTPENTATPTLPGQEQRFRPAPGAATAPVTGGGVVPTMDTRRAAEGAVIDENRVNPFTGEVRRAVPGTFGSREAARRAGTEVPGTEEAARGWGSADYGTARAARGVVPTAGAEPLGDAEMARVVRGPPLASNEQARYPRPTLTREDEARARDAATRNPSYTVVPPRGAKASHAETTQAHNSLREQAGSAYQDRITPRQVQDEVERRRDAQREQVVDAYRGAILDEKTRNDPNAANRQNAKYKDFLATTGVTDVQTRPGSTPRDFLHRRGEPTTDPQELRLEAAQRQAAAMYPWVGRDQDKRNAAVAEIMKRADEYDKAIAVEELRGEKARDVAGYTIEKQRVANEGLLAKQEAIRDANRERDQFKAGEKMKVEAFKANFGAAVQADRNKTSILREMIRGRPDLITDPIAAEKVLGTTMYNMGLDPKQAMSVARMLEGFDPNTGEYVGPENAMKPSRGGGGGGVIPTGGGGRAPSSIDAAGTRGLRPGAEGYLTHNGTNYKYIVGPDGNWYDEGEYRRRFAR